MNQLTIILASAAAAATALASTTAAIAQPPVIVQADAPQASVSYADLNIGSGAGQDRLADRIRGAARDLCLENAREELQVTLARRHCYDTAVGSGLEQMRAAIAARESGVTLAAATLTIRGR